MHTVSLNHRNVGVMIHLEQDWNVRMKAQRWWHLGSGLWVGMENKGNPWLNWRTGSTNRYEPSLRLCNSKVQWRRCKICSAWKRTNATFHRYKNRGEENNSECRWDSRMHYIGSIYRSSFVRAKTIWRRGGDIQEIARASQLAHESGKYHSDTKPFLLCAYM